MIRRRSKAGHGIQPSHAPTCEFTWRKNAWVGGRSMTNHDDKRGRARQGCVVWLLKCDAKNGKGWDETDFTDQ